MKCLIDADSLLYKICFSAEEIDETLSSDEEEVYTIDLEECKLLMSSAIDNIIFNTYKTEALLVFSGEENFRLSLPTPYKDNRKGKRKPTGMKELQDWTIKNYECVVTNGYEADDYVVHLKAKEPRKWKICAIDKDVLYQSVGTHYNYGKDTSVSVTRKEAVKYKYHQCLMGDSADGYKGCKGIGEVKSLRILEELDNEQDYWDAVVKAYEKAGMTEEDAVLTMQLADMHQLNDKGEIELWTPSSIRKTF